MERTGQANAIAEFLRLLLVVFYSIISSLVYLIVPRPRKSLENRVIVLTGAAQGIGKIIAEKLAKLGARCVLVDVDRTKNDATAAEINKKGLKVWSYACDVSNQEQIAQMHKWIQDQVGPVDILINNAGIVNCQELLAIDSKQIKKNFDVNTLSHVWMIREFLPSMKARGEGHILATASIAGILGTAFLTDYCASKFAVRGLMHALEEELHCQGYENKIHLTTVCPLAIKTSMFESPKSRFPWLMPILEPETVADGLIDALVTNQREVIIPNRVTYFNAINSILPERAGLEIQRFLGYEVGVHRKDKKIA